MFQFQVQEDAHNLKIKGTTRMWLKIFYKANHFRATVDLKKKIFRPCVVYFTHKLYLVQLKQ